MKRPSTSQGFTIGSGAPREGFVQGESGRHHRIEKPGKVTKLPSVNRDAHWTGR